MADALPTGWATTALSNLGEWRGGGTPSKAVSDYWEHGTIPWVSPKDMKRPLIDSAEDRITARAVRESATNLIPPHSVLMVTRSGILAHTFPVAVNTVSVTINQDIKAVTPVDGMSSTYLAHFLGARSQQILRTCSKDGTTVSSIDTDRLAGYPVCVAPANEQRRIVSKIDELFSRIDEGEAALAQVEKLVERYRQSVLKAAVTGELTRDWRAAQARANAAGDRTSGAAEARKRAGEPVESGEALLARILKARRAAWETAELAKLKAKGKPPTDDRWKQKYQEPAPPDTTDLPELPEGWVWASMEQLSRSSSYGTSTKCAYGGTGVLVLRIPNIRGGRLDLSDIKHANTDVCAGADDFLSCGDLLVVRTNGSSSLIGVGCVVTEPMPMPCYFASYLIRFRLVLPAALSAWVNLCWQSHVVRKFVGERKATSAGQYNISQSSLMELCLPLAPVAEMQEVAATAARMASEADSAQGCSTNELQRSAALRQSILKAAFSGQLVPQDPHDEPASQLLERIAADRAQAPAKARHSRKTRGSTVGLQSD